MKQTGDQVTIERLLPLATLAPGKYTLEVSRHGYAFEPDDFQDRGIHGEDRRLETKTAANAAPGEVTQRETGTRSGSWGPWY